MCKTNLMLLLGAVVFAGCETRPGRPPAPVSNGASVPKPFRPTLVTTFGTNTTTDGLWRIGVSETSLELSRSADEKHMGWGSVGWTTTRLNSESGWHCHPGWLVYTESASKVWAYDGERKVVLENYEMTGMNSKSALYDSHAKFPCSVPAEVLSRLSEAARRDIQSRE